MNSIKFLSVSLLLITLSSFVRASEDGTLNTQEDTKPVLSDERVSSSALELHRTESEKSSSELDDKEGYLKQALSYLTTVSNTQLGLGATVAAVGSSVMAYRYNTPFQGFVNETADKVKSQVEKIKKHKKKAAIVLGGLSTAAAVSYYDASSKVSHYLSSKKTSHE